MAKQLPHSQTEPARSWTSSTPSVQWPREHQLYRSFASETQVSVIHPPKLIPAQDLIAFEQGQLCSSGQPSGRQQPEAFRLLKVNIQPFESRNKCDSKKRLKRRRERRVTERPVCKSPQSDKQLASPDPPEHQEVESRTCVVKSLGLCSEMSLDL
ncbi:hypothetical protein scyTo_0022492 [Scyliorhinus torazame]|uniref:Uncharacterized protein n=1 Tax=Scyliorhinus torazame TaxID=75743 RepID=A0A401Q7H1_SCYTO|nr:hypothetical protein [Scyliorhinus torazame]